MWGGVWGSVVKNFKNLLSQQLSNTQCNIINYSHNAVYYIPRTYLPYCFLLIYQITGNLYLLITFAYFLYPHTPPLATSNLRKDYSLFFKNCIAEDYINDWLLFYSLTIHLSSNFCTLMLQELIQLP